MISILNFNMLSDYLTSNAIYIKLILKQIDKKKKIKRMLPKGWLYVH